MQDHLTDERTRGFTAEAVSDARYEALADDEQESHGMALKTIGRGSRVLDVGCGTGQFASALRDRLGCDVLGIEPHETRANQARLLGLDVITGYLERNTLSGVEPFDVVTMIDVLEHVGDPVELLTIAAESLNPGGTVIISVPNVAHWTIRLKLLFGRFDYRPSGLMDATHLRWFTRKTIGNVVVAAKLNVRSQDVSRGHWLAFYQNRLPWRAVPPTRRRTLLNHLCTWLPGLFGCQHFVTAVKA